jgi:hypothetical protein
MGCGSSSPAVAPDSNLAAAEASTEAPVAAKVDAAEAKKDDGPLDPKSIELCMESWKTVETISTVASDLFYKNLFKINPSVKALFNSHIPADAPDSEQEEYVICHVVFYLLSLSISMSLFM